MAGRQRLLQGASPVVEMGGAAAEGGRGWLHRAWRRGVGVCLFMVVVFFCLVSSPHRARITGLMLTPQKLSGQKDPPESFDVPKGFLVHSPSCGIPDLDPRHPSIQKLIVDPKPIICKGPPAFTSARGSTLYLHRDILLRHLDIIQQTYWDKLTTTTTTTPVYPAASSSSSALPELSSEGGRVEVDVDAVRCCYRGMHRVEQTREKAGGAADRRWRYNEACQPFNASGTEVQEDAALILCSIGEIVVYKNVHYFFRKRETAAAPSVQESTQSPPLGTPSDTPSSRERQVRVEGAEKLSVIFIGTDAASRLNMLRHLPKTYEYLTKELGALDMQGFNKVGHNTFPNIVAYMGGYYMEEVDKTCVTKRRHHDDCHWIWKDFKRSGYVTAYMEDAPFMGAFHYLRPGFITQPTDFYSRPFFLASEKEIGQRHTCQGPDLSLKVVHDYSLEFSRTFLDTPSFGFFWTASTTHNAVNALHHADEPHLRYLKELEEMGALNHTAVFFVSDHGMHYGKFRATYMGMLEVRLPYVVIYLPPWFRRKYDQAYANLVTNTRRLTANFDVHETLVDLAYGRFADLDHVTSTPSNATRGISLFRSVPWNRTCADAGISQHFCACQNTVEVAKNDSKVYPAAEFLREFLNEELRPYPQCEQFSEVEVNSVRVYHIDDELKPKELKSEVRTYLLQATLSPGGVVVEASVRHSQQDNAFTLLGSPSRIDKYGNTSGCVRHDLLRQYCYCRDQKKAQRLSSEFLKMQDGKEVDAAPSKGKMRRKAA